jgi:hypothetical protein
VCKELDDLVIYDLDKRRWVQLFEEVMLSPIRQKYGNIIPIKSKDQTLEYILEQQPP